jgi:hypothetical protein
MHYEIEIGKLQTFSSRSARPTPSKVIKAGSIAKRRPRNTCENCNAGWMRHIEEAARPIVSALMLGQPLLLDTFNQRLLAVFLCLVAMRIELGGQMPRVTPDSDHRFLIQQRNPPPDWQIWIAEIGDGSNHYWFARLPMQFGAEYNVQVTTLAAGKLFAHLFNSPVWTDFPGYEEPKLSRIWPVGRFDINTGALPKIPKTMVPWVHETIARGGNPIERTG